MVKIGDSIIVDDKEKGKVTHILRNIDGRYVICYKSDGNPHYFIEGDSGYKVLRK